MATTEVLLIKPVDNLGGEGEQVRVRAGYARNFLLPQKLAVPLNKANRKQIEALQKARAIREKKDLEAAQEIAKKIAEAQVAIAVKTGEGGRMFGSVTAANLQERLAEQGIEIDRKQIGLHSPIRTLGQHTTRIRLHPEISVDFEYDIVSENVVVESDDESEAEN
ncbi:MAG TPA: 50S ribosomal protein L9 [Opitutales bacterium]|nr:50S ribosomal protein L9 [Opitutales bacterium]